MNDENPFHPSCAQRLEKEVASQTQYMRRQQAQFRRAAEMVAADFAKMPGVLKIVLFGSVASPLNTEIPRFRTRGQRVPIPHECKDVDLAVWVDASLDLGLLRKTLGRTVNRLFEEEEIGVAHHQVDVFLLEPSTSRYLGRLCHFAICPKGKLECLAPACGARPFLQQNPGFNMLPEALHPERAVILFERKM